MTAEDNLDIGIGESNSQIPIQLEQSESVKITLNAKGNYQYEVKLLEINLVRLKEITDKLEEMYKIKHD